MGPHKKWIINTQTDWAITKIIFKNGTFFKLQLEFSIFEFFSLEHSQRKQDIERKVQQSMKS